MLKYQQIAKKIERNIIENNISEGTKLPKFEELIHQYGVSKSTIVKALDILENRGVLYQVQGSGVFVRKRKRRGYINILESQGFTTDLDEFTITSKVLSLTLEKPNMEVNNYLHCEEDEEVYHLKRIRYINGQILCLEDSYFRKKYISFLSENIAKDSIFQYIEEGLKLTIGFSEKYLHTIRLDEERSEYLSLKKGDPALFLEEVFYLTSGEPFDFSKTTYHFEHSQFYVQGSSIRL